MSICNFIITTDSPLNQCENGCFCVVVDDDIIFFVHSHILIESLWSVVIIGFECAEPCQAMPFDCSWFDSINCL